MGTHREHTASPSRWCCGVWAERATPGEDRGPQGPAQLLLWAPSPSAPRQSRAPPLLPSTSPLKKPCVRVCGRPEDMVLRMSFMPPQIKSGSGFVPAASSPRGRRCPPRSTPAALGRRSWPCTYSSSSPGPGGQCDARACPPQSLASLPLSHSCSLALSSAHLLLAPCKVAPPYPRLFSRLPQQGLGPDTAPTGPGT